MLVQPRVPKQKIKRRLQVDDIKLDIEFDRANGKRNNQDPQRIMVRIVKRGHSLHDWRDILGFESELQCCVQGIDVKA